MVKEGSVMEAFRSIVYKIDDKLGMIANLTLVANMFLIVYSVIGRVIFSKPLGGLVDMVSFIFALTCVFSFCYTEREEGHVRMDLFLQKFPRVGKIILHTFLGIVALAILALIVITMFQYAAKTLQAHNVSMTIAIPYFPFVLVTAVSMALFLVTMLINFLHAYDEWRAK